MLLGFLPGPSDITVDGAVFLCHRRRVGLMPGDVLDGPGGGDLSLAKLLGLAQTSILRENRMDLTDPQLRSLSQVALAYIGDAVYELFIRGALLLPPKRIQAYHRQVVNQVRAEKQSYYLQELMPLLTDAEQDILRRGRNASPQGPKRLHGQTYQRATGFEALIGYLYLTDQERLVELLSHIDLKAVEDSPSGGG